MNRILRGLGGMLGLILACETAIAQFASERPGSVPAPAPAFGGLQPPAAMPPAPRTQPGAVPSLPGGLQPATPPGSVVPAGFTSPAPGANPFMLPDPSRRERTESIPTTINPNAPPHPWSVRPENGAWMICVRSFVGPDSRVLAEKLTKEIRETHKVAAYMFSRNAEELRREREQIEAIRKAEQVKSEPFLKAVEDARKQAEADGREFIPSAPRIKTPKPYHEMPEQWAVLIGGFPDSAAARKALDVVRKLPPPKDISLMDPIVVQRDGGGKAEGTYLNPYTAAMVVPNPAAAKVAADEKYKLEPFLVKLNEDVKYSLLKVKKPWTLQVKSFTVPMKVVSRDNAQNVFERALGSISGQKSMLDVTAEQAEQLAESLRHPEMKPQQFESYVLHHRTGSLVCVGGFDSPNDPELIRIQRLLQGMTFVVKKQKDTPAQPGAPGETQRMFDSVSAMPVPKY